MPQPTKAPSQTVVFLWFARMKALPAPAPGRLMIPYLAGSRKLFDREDQFVGIANPDDAETLKMVQANGEIPERGGEGGPLFDVVDEAGLLEILSREHQQSLLRGGTGATGQTASAALANALRLRVTLPGMAGGATPGMAPTNARSASEILASKRAASAPAATAAPQGETVPDASPTLGRRRRKGGGASAQPEGS